MKLNLPGVLIAQGFGENANPLYSGQGLKGHTGIDFAYNYGDPLPSFINAYCYSTLNKDNPNLMAFRAVFTLVEDGAFVYEISYGHCNQMFATPKTNVKEGEIIATCGNTGDVFSYGKEITLLEKQMGSHAGAHLHFQVRKTKKVPITVAGKHYIFDGNGLLNYNGTILEIVDYDNGYNGCVDPMPFFDAQFIFTKNLWMGQTNSDVLELQKRLGVRQTGFFGSLTFAAVRAYQTAKSIIPTGFVGPLTRGALNATI